MRLEPGRVEGMIAEATANQSAIHCHSTIYRDDTDRAVCRGFFDNHPTFPLQLAAAMGIIEEVPPPRKDR